VLVAVLSSANGVFFLVADIVPATVPVGVAAAVVVLLERRAGGYVEPSAPVCSRRPSGIPSIGLRSSQRKHEALGPGGTSHGAARRAASLATTSRTRSCTMKSNSTEENCHLRQRRSASNRRHSPLALGFFGLGVGYLIYGPQELVGYPPRHRNMARGFNVPL
jgi:hypothetical protein